MAKNIAAAVRELVAPVATEMGYILWDVEFLREGATNILRITIDREGGVGIDDCEKLHRAVDPLLDEADLIEQSYCLEVSSPGLGRQIKNSFQAGLYIGEEVELRLFAPDDTGRKILRGVMTDYTDGTVTVGDITYELKKAAKLRLCDDEPEK